MLFKNGKLFTNIDTIYQDEIFNWIDSLLQEQQKNMIQNAFWTMAIFPKYFCYQQVEFER